MFNFITQNGNEIENEIKSKHTYTHIGTHNANNSDAN